MSIRPFESDQSLDRTLADLEEQLRGEPIPQGWKERVLERISEEATLASLSHQMVGEPVPESWKTRTLHAVHAAEHHASLPWPTTILVSSALAGALLLMNWPLLTMASSIGIPLLVLGYGSGLRFLMEKVPY